MAPQPIAPNAAGSAPASRRVGFDREMAARLRRVVGDFATSEMGGRAGLLALLLLALLLGINALNVVNSYVGRNFMTAIQRRDNHAFVNQALFYAAVFAASGASALASSPASFLGIAFLRLFLTVILVTK